MNFLLNNNLLDIRSKIHLGLSSQNHSYLLEDIITDPGIYIKLHHLNTDLSAIFGTKYNKLFDIYYNISLENSITPYELIIKYIEEYQIITNFLDLITSTLIEEEQIIDHHLSRWIFTRESSHVPPIKNFIFTIIVINIQINLNIFHYHILIENY